ncbi:hypothetical protein [Clostridium tarantellae]|uniref:Uncharacterized protein n=1 Tax=Clostridium tarantellae TaxID=39493 RepID=A0A6I1MIM0_9CLOT|nr:hypothetical protein [Clostridium tarantellae]MPQ43215.1 hypothetical protein [Clostridium tarantellae]
MSYYSTNYYGEDVSNNLINQKPTLLAPISFLKNQFDEEVTEEIVNIKSNHSSKISNLENTNSNKNKPSKDLSNSSYNTEEFNSINEKNFTNNPKSTTMLNSNLDEKKLSNKNILNSLNKNDSNNSKSESYKPIKHTNEKFSTSNKKNVTPQNTFNGNTNTLNSINENKLESNEFFNPLENFKNTKIHHKYNKICDSSFQFFPSPKSNWFGINIEKSDVSNLYFNDFKIDENSSIILPNKVSISSTKFKYIAHTNLNCLCLQPKYNKDLKKFQPAYAMQVIENLDFKNFCELKFYCSKFDYNHFKAQGSANNTTYNLRISATLFLNDISSSLCEFIENSKNWPITSNNTFLKFSYSPLFQILIPEGTPNEIILTGSTSCPILSDYKFNFYNYIPNFDDTNFHIKNNDLIKANKATLVFIAEALDPNNPAGICLLDDIYFL